ncbi:MAG: hypothetical protein KC478_16035, partial [Bacteriovoracaceae bacterium]|nr:hypothetical protein [Bacteriovoracaceae bacterium]
ALNQEVLVAPIDVLGAKLKQVKVIIPGHCNLFPEFGKERLFEVPLNLGWLSRRNSERELNETGLK